MAVDLAFRTEDINQSELLDYFVESPGDRSAVDALKGRAAVILRGSRGVGKSFLLRVAEAELYREFESARILPIYLTFNRAGIIRDPSGERFLHWMISKICNRIVRAISTYGLAMPSGSVVRSISGGAIGSPSVMEELEQRFEDSWKGNSSAPALDIDVPAPEILQDAVQELCVASGLKRIVLLIDEAAHVFLPDQQRQFFTLMRDLRSPYIAVKAAVYPGATAYGDTFQPTHDATTIVVDRSVTEDRYVANMREMVYKQDSSLRSVIKSRGEVFDTLAIASSGNPRTLLKTIARTDPFNSRTAADVLRTYYREEIWAEHSSLGERYVGHRTLIDWGREFLEENVVPNLYGKNRRADDKYTSSYLWVHRDAPQAVKEALRLLCYSGILGEGEPGVKGTRSEPGTRYMVNLGCQFALDENPIRFGKTVRDGLSIRRMVEYGENHAAYRPIATLTLSPDDLTNNQALDGRLQASIDNLDVTKFQMKRLRELNFTTIGQVLESDEAEFRKAHYVGVKRARQIQNAAVEAVLEYLSG